NGDGQLRANTADGHQLLKQLLLGGMQKSVERKQILAHVRVDKKRNLRASRGQLGKSWHADVYFVADSTRLNDDLIRMLGQQFSAQVGNHAQAIVAAGICSPIILKAKNVMTIKREDNKKNGRADPLPFAGL